LPSTVTCKLQVINSIPSVVATRISKRGWKSAPDLFRPGWQTLRLRTPGGDRPIGLAGAVGDGSVIHRLVNLSRCQTKLYGLKMCHSLGTGASTPSAAQPQISRFTLIAAIEKINHFGFVLPNRLILTFSCSNKILQSIGLIALGGQRHRSALDNHVTAADMARRRLLARAGGFPSCHIESSDCKLAPR
jgi:hypothetical protein